ncbi:aconitate hydratase AcnA [Paraburkholderia tropica]|uniref:aconitate hydratase AcnA n=1 Tax=Paraburkholderia tropica TaxID=92647 RepID=UPI003019BFF9
MMRQAVENQSRRQSEARRICGEPFVRHMATGNDTVARYVSLSALEADYPRVKRFPRSLRLLLEAALRNIDAGDSAQVAELGAMLDWQPGASGSLPVWVGRILLQDASGIPLLHDLAAMRAAAVQRGHDASRIAPCLPVDLVIDHSVVTDRYGDATAAADNLLLEYRRNQERYAFARWAGQAFPNLRIFPPGSGIVHQVNLEQLATGVVVRDGWIFPDTLLGTDSHTTMINGIGTLGWGVGALEAEIALLGEALQIAVPKFVEVRLTGSRRPGITATDIALHVTAHLRRHGMVGKILEFAGEGARALTVPDRATIANMAPEYGATMAFFPMDSESLSYLRKRGHAEDHIELVRRYAAEQGLFGFPDVEEADYDETVEINLDHVARSVAGPFRPQQLLMLSDVPRSFPGDAGPRPVQLVAKPALSNGDVVIAAITSCTNTANPGGMICAGLLASEAVRRGLKVSPHVKTVLAPGSRDVTAYLARLGLLDSLTAIGFYPAAYGCSVCVGNTGPLAPGVEEAIAAHSLTVSAVLSGNRNFEGRIHHAVKANYLASPALVVAYALAGSTLKDLDVEPIGTAGDGASVYLRDIWPSDESVAAFVSQVDGDAQGVAAKSERRPGGDAATERPEWTAIASQTGDCFQWDKHSGYFVRPPFFETDTGARLKSIEGARILAVFGDDITTDHISPVGEIARHSDAADYLRGVGVEVADFSTFGARRCNHHVMMRGTFANPRIRNLINAVGDGPMSRSARDGGVKSLFKVAMENVSDGVTNIVFAGERYGSGSARDWAARGTALLGISAVVARSFERIHRSNLVLMGVLPVQISDGSDLDSFLWTGEERIDVTFDPSLDEIMPKACVVVRRAGNIVIKLDGCAKIETAAEWRYLRAQGVLPHVLGRALSG